MDSNYKIVDISKIKKIPSQTEVPATRGRPTQRSLCVENPQNRDIIKKMEALKGMWEIIGSDKFQKCVNNLFPEDYVGIIGVDKIKQELTELLIRFDTNPQNYTKQDFDHLMKVICGGLVHIYTVLAAWGNLQSTDADVLKIKMYEDHIEWQPQVGDMNKCDEKTNEATDPENEKKIAKIGNIREYIENRLTWITEKDLK